VVVVGVENILILLVVVWELKIRDQREELVKVKLVVVEEEFQVLVVMEWELVETAVKVFQMIFLALVTFTVLVEEVMVII
jgi:hypothetical protein